jgi:hypothetical protein
LMVLIEGELFFLQGQAPFPQAQAEKGQEEGGVLLGDGLFEEEGGGGSFDGGKAGGQVALLFELAGFVQAGGEAALVGAVGGANRKGGPPGGHSGSIYLNLAQFGSGSGGKQALLGGVGAVLLTDARDLADALLVCMRGNESKNASRLKSYGRFLDGLYVLLMDVDFPGPRLGGR